jgi:hypothetical protein
MRRVDRDEAGDPIRPGQREPPRHHAAPVVPDHDRLRAAERVERRDHVGGERIERVGGETARLVREVVAALVGGEHPAAGGGEGVDLVAPAVVKLRKAVQEHDGRA